MTHVQKLQLQKGNGIVLVEAQDAEGRDFYAYIEMSRPEMEELSRAQDSGSSVDLTKKGKLIVATMASRLTW